MPASAARAERIAATAVPPPAHVMRARTADQIAPQRVGWLWPDWLPAGRLTLFGGRPGEGKSAVMLDILARLTTGSPMPDGHRPEGPLSVLVLSGEDDPADTLVPRLMAAGADLSRVVIANGEVLDVETQTAHLWSLPGDVGLLRDRIVEHGIEVAVVDPLAAFTASNIDTHRDAQVRSMLLPLATVARQQGCAVLASRHWRKGGASDPRDAGAGSIAYTAAARVEWAAGRDPQDQGRRVLAVAKVNIGREPTSLAYRLVPADDAFGTVRVAWDGACTVTATQLVGDPVSDDERGALDEAEAFLLELLAAGPVPAKDAKRQASEAGISETAALRRAKERLRVRSRKTSTGAWVWELRGQGEQREQQSKDPHLAPVAQDAHLPSTHTLNKGLFSRGTVEGEQGEQGDVFRARAHLPVDDYDLDDLNEGPDDDTLRRWAEEAEALQGSEVEG